MQLQEHQQQWEAAGVQIAIVTFENAEIARGYVQRTGQNWPFLIDGSRTLYQAYGLERGSWWNLSGPATTWLYLKLFARGRRFRFPTGDVKQLGGDVLIDPAGIVRFHYRGNGPADRPEIATMLDIVQKDASDGAQ